MLEPDDEFEILKILRMLRQNRWQFPIVHKHRLVETIETTFFDTDDEDVG